MDMIIRTLTMNQITNHVSSRSASMIYSMKNILTANHCIHNSNLQTTFTDFSASVKRWNKNALLFSSLSAFSAFHSSFFFLYNALFFSNYFVYFYSVNPPFQFSKLSIDTSPKFPLSPFITQVPTLILFSLYQN